MPNVLQHAVSANLLLAPGYIDFLVLVHSQRVYFEITLSSNLISNQMSIKVLYSIHVNLNTSPQGRTQNWHLFTICINPCPVGHMLIFFIHLKNSREAIWIGPCILVIKRSKGSFDKVPVHGHILLHGYNTNKIILTSHNDCPSFKASATNCVVTRNRSWFQKHKGKIPYTSSSLLIRLIIRNSQDMPWSLPRSLENGHNS